MNKYMLGNGTEAPIGNIPVITPSNIGKGIKWNNETGTYEVNLGKGLELGEDGSINLKLDKSSTNTIVIKNDGSIYQGSVAERSFYYVDYELGLDSNNGDKATPLRTIVEALKRVPRNTGNVTIFLKEGQTHVISYPDYIRLYATITVVPYGTNYDSLESRWNSARTGWHVLAAKEYDKFRPIIKVIPSWQISPYIGTNVYTPTWIEIHQQNKITFKGIKFTVDYGAKEAHMNWGWNSMFMGSGYFEFIDCTILNANNGGKWTMVDDHDHQLTVIYRRMTLQSTNPSDAITGISKRLVCEIEGQDTEKAHFSGLTWKATTNDIDIKNSVRGNNSNTPSSTNYITNL